MIKALTFLIFCGAVVAQAQLTPAPYLPQQCQSAAQAAANNVMVGTRLVAILNGNYTIPGIGATGMSLTDGKARAWIYAFYEPEFDTLFFKPFGHVFNNCTDASDFLPAGTVPAAQLGSNSIPNGYIEGTALITALNSSGEYETFHFANPDSLPAAAVLTVTNEDLMDFPAGTPFWFLTWNSTPTGPGLTCFVHALTSQTICMTGPQSVADDAVAAGFNLAPNPAFEEATLKLPMSWMGTTVSVVAVDPTGASVVLRQASTIVSPAASLALNGLAQGAYTLRVDNGREAFSIPLNVIR